MADVILLMYDITNKRTFESIAEWVKSIKEQKGNDFPIILIGNKCDLEDEREVKKEDGEKKAEDYGFLFGETSSKDNINLQETINAIINKITEESIQINNGRKSFILEEKKLKKKKRKCKC